MKRITPQKGVKKKSFSRFELVTFCTQDKCALTVKYMSNT